MNITSSQSIQSLLVGMLRDPSKLTNQEVDGISLDSRELDDGFMFLSLAKDSELRLQFLQQALTKQLAIVLYDEEQPLTNEEQQLLEQTKTAYQAVKELAEKSGEIAARFYGHPSMALTVIAITGTNGKTSVSQFIAQALESLSIPCGVIGTLGIGRIGTLTDTGMTTPDPVTMQKILAGFHKQNINHVVIEASSHALCQGRLNSVSVDVAVFTNLTRDHLDYHQTMAEYAQAKARLFKFESIKTAVINCADDFGRTLINELSINSKLSVSTYSRFCLDKKADLQAENIVASIDGLAFELLEGEHVNPIRVGLFGEFNVDNLLATIASLNAIGLKQDDVISAVAKSHSVNGRMEMLGGGKHVTVVVDFAHTPDALKQALSSLKKHISDDGQLLCVFGCGGDRDSGKRSQMGETVEKYANRFVITDDNPRTESAQQIVADILSGLKAKDKALIEHNRKLAITSMIQTARQGDIVLVAGKGHEQYQDIAGIKHPFSDKQIITELLSAANDSDMKLREVK